ncbi:hypothetical protein C8R42DRAFT_722353 [Lentinula raphanica]|nr:hypothetical protein C8R42DRAFT_722353 [Lentinula raphanica]
MSSCNAGSSSSCKQYAVRELRSKAANAEDLKFNSQLRARDNLSSKKPVLFLPASERECGILQRHWPSFPNSFSSSFNLPRYASPDTDSFPQALPSDYKTYVPDTFYPELLVQFYDGFSKGSVCRDEGFTLYRALSLVQEALSQVMAEPKSKAKDALLKMLKRESYMTSALGYYRVFWHKSRLCPLFALRFICLLCDFCEKTLSKTEYSSKLYNETTRRGLGVDKELRAQVRSLKCPAHTAASLAIPLPLDPLTFEGQLLITVAQSSSPGNVLHHPITGNVLLPDSSGLDNLPPASPLLNAWEDDDFENEGPASPIDEKEGPASPAAGIDEYDDGETEVSEDIEAKDIFKAPKGKGKAKATIGIPRVRPSKASSAKVGPPVASRPAPKPSKHTRDTSSPVADAKAKTSGASDKTSKETLPPQVPDAAVNKTSKGSKATRDASTEPEC